MPYVAYERISEFSSARIRRDGIGDRFGLLKQVGPSFPVRQPNSAKLGGSCTATMCVCECDCGIAIVAKMENLRSGNTKSCGCVSARRITVSGTAVRRVKKHNATRSPTHVSWERMRSRCNYEGDPSYRRYGGRGIRVCERWEDFSLFMEDMGERPEGASLDRIDPNGDYCPENCRWATSKEQSRNRTDNTRLTICGRSMCVAEWCEQVGAASDPTIRQRLKRGWPHELAVFG